MHTLLATELYSKPSTSFQYLHRTSFHPPHTLRSILKSQFIRIRRICTDIDDYWNHSQQFITFLKSRGFHNTILNKICQDIANILRRNLFRNINGTLLNALLTPNKSNRIPLVTTWHHKLSGFQSILHRHYQEMINEYPHIKFIFSEPLILSFRRNKNLRNWLVHSCSQNLLQKLISLLVTVLHVHPNEAKGCKLCPAMSNTSSITNKLTNKSCLTSGGKCNTTDTIYTAECTKHNKHLLVFLAPDIIFIGQMEKDIGRGVSRVQYLSTADQ